MTDHYVFSCINIFLSMSGFCGGLVGSKVISLVIKRVGRQSFLTFFLAGLIVASGIAMSSVVVLQMTGYFPRPRSDQHTDICSLSAHH